MSALNALLTAARNRIREAFGRSDTLGRFVRLASWTMAAFALEKGATIVIVFLLAGILGAEDYGRLTLAQGLVNTLQIFVVLGAGSMIGRYVPALREQGVRRAVEVVNLCAVVVLGTTAVFTVAALAGVRVIAVDVLDMPAGSLIPYWIIAWVVLTAFNSLLLTVMLSFERGRALGVVSLVGAVLSIATVPAMGMTFGVEGVVVGLVAVEAAKVIALVALYGGLIKHAGVRILASPRRSDLPLLFSFGLPVFLNSVIWAPTIWLAQFIVKTHAPNGLAAVGVFGVANSILGAVILLSGLTNRAALPMLSSLHARGELAQMKRMTWMMTLGQFAAAVVFGLPLALAAPFIMAQAGATFEAYWPVLIIMIATGAIIAGQTALGNHILVNDRPYYILLTALPWAFTLLASVVFFSSKGPYALAWGLFLASGVRTILFAVGFVNLKPCTISERAL